MFVVTMSLNIFGIIVFDETLGSFIMIKIILHCESPLASETEQVSGYPAEDPLQVRLILLVIYYWNATLGSSKLDT